MDNQENTSAIRAPRILIIDDDQDILDLAKALLEDITGREVFTALGGEEGYILFKLYEPNHFDIITLDLNMPDLDGIKLVRLLAEAQFAGAVAFLSAAELSVLESVEQLARAYQLENLGSISKPFNKSNLGNLVSDFNKRQRHNTYADTASVTLKEMTDGLAAGEFTIAYQPKICAKTKRFLAVEALCRWRHGEKGLISPDVFINAAEENGFINRLTNYVVQTSLTEIKKLLDLVDKNIELSINISRYDLDDLDFPDYLDFLLKSSKVPANQIIFELTENRLYNSENPKSSREVLTRIKLLGMKLSIDEFVPGISPVNKLSSLPFNEMKISKLLANEALVQEKAKDIIMHNFSMCKELNLKTVVQGVETKEEWDFFAQCGCDMIQGFYIAKPIPIHQLMSWAKAWQAVMFDNELGT